MLCYTVVNECNQLVGKLFARGGCPKRFNDSFNTFNLISKDYNNFCFFSILKCLHPQFSLRFF